MQVHVRMRPRDSHEPHRVSTPLELFFDLAFVVAVAQAASSLHHGLVEGHVADALIGFPAVFFAIWWAWMNFAWFASAFDCDDVLYRLAVFAQMTGVLVLAAGVPRAFDTQDFGIMTLGYVIMRLAMVSQWLRVAVSFEGGRRTALRFALGITVLQVGWVLRLALPDGAAMVAFVVLVVAELLVPVWAERAGRTPWHPHHMAERYGLFTIIVLGESVLSATLAVQGALDTDSTVARPPGRDRRRAADRVLDVVDLLRAAHRAHRGTGPAGRRRARSRSCGATGTTSCSRRSPPRAPGSPSPSIAWAGTRRCRRSATGWR